MLREPTTAGRYCLTVRESPRHRQLRAIQPHGPDQYRTSGINGVSESVEAAAAESMVVGGTGIVGGYIVEHLIRAGQHPLALSRVPRCPHGVAWFPGDLRDPGPLKAPPLTTLYRPAQDVS